MPLSHKKANTSKYVAILNNAISKRSLLRRLDLNNLAGFKTDASSLLAVVSRSEERKVNVLNQASNGKEVKR